VEAPVIVIFLIAVAIVAVLAVRQFARRPPKLD
jgi:hypothetical protein